MRRVLLLAVLVAGAGCGAAYRRADDLLARGEYLQAAEHYERLLRAEPGDRRARRGRDAARIAAVRRLLAPLRAGPTSTRPSARAALATLERGLALLHRWDLVREARLAPEVREAVAAASARAREAVLAPAHAGDVLTAEAVQRELQPFLGHAELASLRRELAAALADAARQTCARLTAAGSGPYWAALLHRYCGHFGVATPPAGLLPHQRRAPLVQGTVAGLTAGEAARLRRQVRDWFAASRWHAADAPAAATATLAGRSFALFAERPVTLTRPWIAHVPYSAQESYQQTYQEPYTTTEYYSEQVPTTRLETYTYSCGSSTCTGTRSVTSYTTQTRSRVVTKYRTATRTATRTVTRYRDEHRVYSYPAVERRGEYRTDLRLRLELGADLEPVKLRLIANDDRSGYDHDAEFPPAKLAPERADLPDREAWLERQAAELQRTLQEILKRHFARQYCRLPRYSLEQAARCVWWTDETPRRARDALAAVLGADADRLATLGPAGDVPAPIAPAATRPAPRPGGS